MQSNLDLHNDKLFGPVAFRPDFNNFEKISATQAWSLLFTGSREDKALGLSLEIGRFFNTGLIAILLTGTLWSLVFRTV